ncbi:ribonuclease H-like domain-containing protein [Tanacetum coccineum]
MLLFRHKYLADGMLSRYKARLVANGSTQLEGIDVDETFSLVVKPGTIRTVLSLATSRHWPIHQLDVKNAFLHEDLSVMVYMHQPPGFRYSAHPDYRIIRFLHQEFAMTDLGSLNYFFGISVTRDSSRMFLSQKKYDVEILERAGSLQYLTFTRPDISYAVQQSSKRQPTLSRSSAEAGYRGVANVVAETCWLRNLLRELHTLLSSATLVYCDNVSVVYLSCNPVQHQRTKHIEIDIHFVRDLVAAGEVRVLRVPSRYQFADIFTKACLQLYLRSFGPV